MIYNNLIALLFVVLLLSSSSIPDAPQLPMFGVVGLFLAKGLLFLLAVRRLYRPARILQVSSYLRAEQKGIILAVAFFALDLYVLDYKYYAAVFPVMRQLPVLTDLCGLALFFAYLVIVWSVARESYGRVTDGSPPARFGFVVTNIKANLAILLPWLFLSLASDFLQYAKIPILQQALATPWGEAGIFCVFFLILLIVFPMIMVRLWGCTPLPDGPARQRIEAFCVRQRLRYREIVLWPLFGGQMVTAGVLGVAGRFRYLLVTRALLEACTPDELEAVMAHEAGHVKRYHLPLYLFLFLGFGLMVQLSAYPLTMGLLHSNLFYKALGMVDTAPGELLTLLSTLPLILLMALYFRFLFGFFMRNFERQADVYSCRVMGDISPMVLVLEKIAWLSGNIRDLPSWHHFGIGQRIDFLKKCRQHPGLSRRHDLKVYAALALYGVVLLVGGVALWKLPGDLVQGAPREKFALAVLEQKARLEPRNYLWHQLLGDVLGQAKQEAEAAAHYEQALSLAPDDADLLNNFAWLLVTATDQVVRDPVLGLKLARKAAAAKEQGFILDTLAMALWVNGHIEEALAAEMRAITVDPAGQDFYRQQMNRFVGAQEKEVGASPP